jgi:uncharacterized protein GlcG (DUF336 family)
MKRSITFALAGCIAAMSAQAASPVVITQKNLSSDAATTVAQAALADCRQRNLKVTITVLDVSGATLVVLRDDGAAPHTVANSDRKAYTALTTRGPSLDFGKRITGNPLAVGMLQLDRITTLEGGLPIRAGTDVIGAIGISGAPSSADDAACANAGIAKIAAELAR